MKTETSHTSGPFIVTDFAQGSDIPSAGVLYIYSAAEFPREHYNDIATVHAKGAPGEQKANAHLFAASPDMLNALEIIASQSIGDDWTSDQALDFIKSHARAAIAKAKGGAV